MSGHRNTLAAVLVVCGEIWMVACAAPSHDHGEHYVFIATNTGLSYWKEAEAGFRDAANALGVKGELVGPTGYQPNVELGVLRSVIEEHPAGICISAARPEIFQADIDNAISQGIPVICVDSDVPRSKRIAYVGTDNFKAGKEGMRRMSTLISGKANIVLVSIEGQNNVDERVAGAADALANFPALKITKILDDKGDPRSAADQISELIQKKEKIDGIICLEASGGSGAAEAVHRFNLDGKLPIVAFDDDPATLDWINKGVIAATVTQKPYVMSYYGLKFLDDLHHNAVHQFKDWHTALAAPVPTFVDTGTVVVDKNNANEYRQALAVRPRNQ